jgi:tRNA U34 5-methylaminomethyl-2-thiouridine-forming methyltransferase MnmC
VANDHPIRFDEHGAPISLRFDDPFFSRMDGPAETRHIFLAGNHLPDRLAAADHFSIGETGFGTGLNALEAWALWDSVKRPGAALKQVSFEAYPLAKPDLARCMAAWPEHAARSAALLGALPDLWPDRGSVVIRLGGYTLEIVIGLVGETLPPSEMRADAWFLDGHSPAKNGDMWSEPLMQAIGRLGAAQSASGRFRRGEAPRLRRQARNVAGRSPGLRRALCRNHGSDAQNHCLL